MDYKTRDRKLREVDRLKEALRKRDLTPITTEAILKVFEEEGYRSLEDYANKLVELIRGQKGIPQRIDVDAFSKRSPDPAAASIKHKVPQVPFVMNGVVHDPKDISRFDGRELFFVGGKNGLRVYEDLNAANMVIRASVLSDHIRSTLISADEPDHVLAPDESEPYEFPWHDYEPHLGGSRVPLPTSPPPCPDPYELYMFEDIDYSGDCLMLRQNYAMPDLTECYTWPFGSDWNDRISSIAPTCSAGIFYEHVQFQGSHLCSNDNHNLAEWGWNDRISSVWCISGVMKIELGL